MELQKYIEQKGILQQCILEFLDEENDVDEIFCKLISIINDQNILENQGELVTTLQLIVIIANNYHRTSNFYSKIDKILSYFKNTIKQTFSNIEIFNIFRKNKRLLLFLIKEGIFTIDLAIADIITKDKYLQRKYPSYFYPEIAKHISGTIIFSQKIQSDIEDEDYPFSIRRENGENDSYICQLIRNDAIEDFISHVNRINLSLKDTIIHLSIYETNTFLYDKTPTLIEYASFFGSIQIFKYLHMNGVELTESLWKYAIHGNNPELIHYIESNLQSPMTSDVLKESIKCHHINFSNYIIYANNWGEDSEFLPRIKYYNYTLFPSTVDDFYFYYCCKYNHIKIVEILINSENKNFEIKNIQKLTNFE